MKSHDTIVKEGKIHWFDYTVHYAAISDKGKVRKGNEDSFLIMEKEAFFGVADGAGGHENGARASMLTTRGLETFLNKTIDLSDDTVPLDTVCDLPLTTEAIHYANSLVFKENNGGHMASTVVACQLHQEKFLLEHVGDSRCYLFRDNQLQQLTEDHSFVNELFRDGKIDREQMKTHKYRNVITRAIGIAKEVNIDSQWVSFINGDLLLLCSDGLSSYVDDELIAQNMSPALPLLKTAEKLVELANEAGGRDNITVILLKFELTEETVFLSA